MRAREYGHTLTEPRVPPPAQPATVECVRVCMCMCVCAFMSFLFAYFLYPIIISVLSSPSYSSFYRRGCYEQCIFSYFSTTQCCGTDLTSPYYCLRDQQPGYITKINGSYPPQYHCNAANQARKGLFGKQYYNVFQHEASDSCEVRTRRKLSHTSFASPLSLWPPTNQRVL